MEKFLHDYKIIKLYRKSHKAPVDLLGAHMLPLKSNFIENYRYQALISVLISSRTKDEKTAIAIKNLQKHGLTISNILQTPLNDIKLLIKDVGFANTKANYILNITRILHEDYNDDIPDNIKDLLKLKGIGEKISTLIMLIAWNKVIGISVDSHIHRIANTLIWVDTKKPNETKVELEKIVPKIYWKEINQILVGFGQLMKTSKNIKKLIDQEN